MDFGAYWCLLVVLDGSWWFLGVLSDFFLILSGSWWV